MRSSSARPLDELLAELKALKDENSDFVRYTSDMGGMLLGAAAVNTLVSANCYHPGVEVDYMRDYEVSVYRLAAEWGGRPACVRRACIPCRSTSNCGECKNNFGRRLLLQVL